MHALEVALTKDPILHVKLQPEGFHAIAVVGLLRGQATQVPGLVPPQPWREVPGGHVVATVAQLACWQSFPVQYMPEPNPVQGVQVPVEAPGPQFFRMLPGPQSEGSSSLHERHEVWLNL